MMAYVIKSAVVRKIGILMFFINVQTKHLVNRFDGYGYNIFLI
jgi:hypothetical protein